MPVVALLSLPVRRFLVAGISVLAVGCAIDEGQVRYRFAATYVCPRDAIVVTARPDVNARPILNPPPPGVAADPVRLRAWDDRHAAADPSLAHAKVFDASGCGHQERYACHQVEDNDPNDVDCRDSSGVRAEAEAAEYDKKFQERQRLFAQMMASEQETFAKQQETLATQLQERIGFGVMERPDGSVVVTGVTATGPAGGRLEVGDVIVSVEGVHLAGLLDFGRVLRERRRPIIFAIARGGEPRTVSLTLP